MNLGVTEILIIMINMVFVVGIPLVVGIVLYLIYKRLKEVENKLIEIDAKLDSIQEQGDGD
jgi:hypothetical protein